MNRRSFISRVVTTVAAFFALRSVAEPAEPVCAWCRGTGQREYAQHPFDGSRPHLRGICDACRQDERRIERVQWAITEFETDYRNTVVMCTCPDMLTCEHPYPTMLPPPGVQLPAWMAKERA